MIGLRIISIAFGIFIVAGDLVDIVASLIVPRPHVSGPVAWATKGYHGVIHAVARRVPSFYERDRFLSITEPLTLLVRLGLWLAGGVVGFAFIIWGSDHASFATSFVESGSSIFTLGFANQRGLVPAFVAFVAAAFGLTVVALQIAYLPSLYDAFSRRENLVTMLESRAGSPPWGPELLARHYLVGIESNLPQFFSDWERWSADVAESHTTYPSLLRLRSPHPTNSWIVGLVSVLDAAALLLSLRPSTAPAEARLCLRMGFTCLRDIATVLNVPFDPDPRPDDPISLTRGDFDDAIKWLENANVSPERTGSEAWPDFVGWRINYESAAYGIADKLFAPPAPWTGPRHYSERTSIRFVRPAHRAPDKPDAEPVPGMSEDGSTDTG
ncbi:MAG TPA: hypothetical protein VEJ87_03030 [Acidimicrobiales bacterium]|nr:hypothetical protein [Acidimicrobiales bacterium]